MFWIYILYNVEVQVVILLDCFLSFKNIKKQSQKYVKIIFSQQNSGKSKFSFLSLRWNSTMLCKLVLNSWARLPENWDYMYVSPHQFPKYYQLIFLMIKRTLIPRYTHQNTVEICESVCLLQSTRLKSFIPSIFFLVDWLTLLTYSFLLNTALILTVQQLWFSCNCWQNYLG